MARGDILRKFSLPQQSCGNGRGLAFDGTALYTTTFEQARIDRISTNGAFLSSVDTDEFYGCLYYDKAAGGFWAGSYDDATPSIKRIDTQGTVLQTILVADVIPAELYGAEEFPTLITGLAVDDATGSLYFCFQLGNGIYHITKDGEFLHFLPVGANSSLSIEMTGMATDQKNLWAANLTGEPHLLYNLTMAGTLIGTLDEASEAIRPFSIAYDDVTFAPKNALWILSASNDNSTVYAVELSEGEPQPQPDDDFDRAVIEIIRSVAQQEIALANVINMECSKLQYFLASGNAETTNAQLLNANESILDMINAITRLENILYSKLSLFKCRFCCDIEEADQGNDCSCCSRSC